MDTLPLGVITTDVQLNHSNNCLFVLPLMLLPKITKTSICICVDLVDLQTTCPRTDLQARLFCSITEGGKETE
jgi:hypothetical protein